MYIYIYIYIYHVYDAGLNLLGRARRGLRSYDPAAMCHHWAKLLYTGLENVTLTGRQL